MLPVLAIFFFTNRLIKVDFPTFGIPTIIALMALGFTIPFACILSNLSFNISCAADTISFIPVPAWELIANALIPLLCKYSIQAFVMALSAISALFNNTNLGLC